MDGFSHKRKGFVAEMRPLRLGHYKHPRVYRWEE